jgi:hypothetical protein
VRGEMILLFGFIINAIMQTVLHMAPNAIGALLSIMLPNTSLTPGAIDPRDTQANIHSTICKSGWTGRVRPPERVTNKIKQQLLPLYNHHTDNPLHFELDHLIPLEIGGAPSDTHNLWPQPYVGEWGARKKDVLEKKLNSLVCAGTITLRQAQSAIRTDWVVAYKTYVLPMRVHYHGTK